MARSGIEWTESTWNPLTGCTKVSPYQEISFKRAMPIIHVAGHKFCTHAACPVPVGIIKAVEIEAKLALPTNVTIKLAKTKE